MAKPSTTHVIEIETGIGEPAFIPLTLGQELQPISVGKKGMWRIESARVLDVHAFVYFDGNSLFLQSADESSSASVDGYRVGKAWTELHAPCKIEIGAARLRFRSLSAPADDQAATEMHHRPPVQAAAPGGGPPPVPRPAAGAPPDEPITFPKAERPFKPGEFSSKPDKDESTRIAPLESTGVRSAPGSVVSSAPRPAAGRSVEEENLTRMEGAGNVARTNRPPGMPPGADPMGMQPGAPGMFPPGMSQPPGMMPGPQPPHMSMPPGMPPGAMSMPPGMPPGAMSMPPGMPPMGMPMPPGSGPYLQGYAGASGAYNSMGPGPISGGGYGANTTGQVGTPDASLLAKYKELSPPKRILVILAPFCLLAAAYLLLFDDEPPPRRPVAARDAGALEASVAMRATSAATPPPSAPPPVLPPSVATPTPVPPSCPPGFVPYSIAINGQIPCVPAGTPMPAATEAGASATASATTPQATPPGQTPPPATAANKTLERQAVDYVATGNYAAAAQVYDQLHQQNPNNPVYPEAVRILRAKANAGAP